MAYSGPEKRKHPRVCARFIVSYRVLEEKEGVDVSQTKNLSLGGMLLTTNCQMPVGTSLAIEIRLPFDPLPILLVARVIESMQVIKDLIYDTRLQFLSIDENHSKTINKTVDYYGKKG